MGHNICGFVAHAKELSELLRNYAAAHVIPLSQGFCFVPMTDELYAQLTAEREFLPDICDERFRYLSSKLFQIGREFSKTTPIAYIETDYFGGTGFQAAVAWNDGGVELCPSLAGREEGFQMDNNYSYPINRALSDIGVQGYLMEDENEDPKDEFDELGLGKYRSNEDWIDSLVAK